MSGCDKYIDLANLSCDGLLTQLETEQLDAHLQTCPSCRGRAEAARALSDAFAGLMEDAPDTLAPGIRYKIELEPGAPKTWKRFLPRGITIAAACVALILILSQTYSSEAPTLFNYSSAQPTAQPSAVLGRSGDELEENYAIPNDEPGPDTEAYYGDSLDGASPAYLDKDTMRDTEAALHPALPSLDTQQHAGESNKGNGILDDAAKTSDSASSGGDYAAADTDVRTGIPEYMKSMRMIYIGGTEDDEFINYDVMEINGFSYVLVPIDEFDVYEAHNSQSILKTYEQTDPDAEHGVVVFYK